MRTIRTKVYQFSELSKQAKKVAIEKYRNSNDQFHWSEENRESMEKFSDIWPIKVTNWSYGGRGEGVSFNFTETDEIENLTGQRLATYIWNNYRYSIYSKKWYNGKTPTKHNKYHATNPAAPKFTTWSRYSKITIEKYNCPLTGYCMDNELLDQVWKFLDKPDNRNFKELLQDCFNDWIKACNADIDYQNSDEFISEELINNDQNFTIDGLVFNY